jgi:ribosome-binding protein aMBF1 (putative translation factor)
MPYPEGSTPQNSHTPESRTRATRHDTLRDPNRKAERDTPQIRLQREILRYRQEKQLTHETIAERLRTTPDYIARIETGDVDPFFSYLVKLAEAMDADIDVSFRPKEKEGITRRNIRKPE